MNGRRSLIMLTVACAAVSGTRISTSAENEDVADLILRLKSDDANARIVAASKLETLGSAAAPAVEAIEAALADENWKVRFFAGQALAEILPAQERENIDRVLALIERFHKGNVSERHRIADELARQGPHARIAVPFLLAALRSPDLRKWQPASEALSRLAPDGDAVPILISKLEEQEQAVIDHYEVIVALIQFGPAANKAAPLLVAILRDEQFPDETRKCAADGLVAVGFDDAELLVPELGNSATSSLARDVLVRIGTVAVPALRKAARKGDAQVRAGALLALAEIAVDRAGVRGTCFMLVSSALKDADLGVQRGALAALAVFCANDVDKTKTVRLLGQIIKDSEREITAEAAQILFDELDVPEDRRETILQVLKDGGVLLEP